MFHTFVGYLHGRLSAEKEKDDKKKSQVVSKVQGLVSMMIMNNRKNGTKDKVQFSVDQSIIKQSFWP